MATFTKFNQFVEDLGRGIHNLHTGTLKVMLTNTAPAATNAVKADITEISAGNGYTAGGYTLANVTYAQTSGTGKLLADDITVAASPSRNGNLTGRPGVRTIMSHCCQKVPTCRP